MKDVVKEIRELKQTMKMLLDWIHIAQMDDDFDSTFEELTKIRKRLEEGRGDPD